MENQGKVFFTEFKEKLTDFVANRVLLLKLQTVAKISKLASLAVIAMLVTIIASMFLLFLSLMGGYYFSEVFDNQFKGFGLIALIYLLLFVLVLFFIKKRLKKYISSLIINIIFDKTSDNDGDEK